MKVFSIRMGFATNSSSTHSLVFAAGAKDSDVNAGRFGWDFFTAASPEARRDYLGCVLNSNMSNFSDSVRKSVVKDWLNVELPEESYIDHQSVWNLPVAWEGEGIDKEFFDDLTKYIMQDDLVILGGNDNTEEKHSLSSGSFKLGMEQDSSRTFVVRKDRDYWTLFDRETGSKIRLSFDFKGISPEKASSPELVDIKITDYCPFGCNFCYQDSTLGGVHAGDGYIGSLARALGKMHVFEVALGGGEPTLHPKFEEILHYFAMYNVVPNFTTKRLDWMHDKGLRDSVKSSCGGIGYSPDSLQGIVALEQNILKYNLEKKRFNIQCVIGSHPIETTLQWIERAGIEGIPVTLLGWKFTGRGKECERHGDSRAWGKALGEYLNDKKTYVDIGIDTVMANEFESLWEKMGIPNWAYSKKEGAFSMYVDAVARRMGPSSFCDEKGMVSLEDPTVKAIKSAFAKW